MKLTPEEQEQVRKIMLTFRGEHEGGPVFKRYDVGDDRGGWEFRPFGGWNYGYPMKSQMDSWVVWVIQIFFSFSESWTRGLAINGLAHLLQETTFDRKKTGGGASFVHNVLGGYNLLRNWDAKSGMKRWGRYAGYLEVVSDGTAIIYERKGLKVAFGKAINHKIHALGFSIGAMVALI